VTAIINPSFDLADFYTMKVYKVLFENNHATSAIPANNLHHGDIEFRIVHKTLKWLAIECSNKKMAMEVADRVAKLIWGERNWK
jgi:hypothetical protein